MTGASDLEATAELLRVLGHGVRLALLNSLASGERSVGDIEAQTGVGQPALSQQLGILRKAGLVTTRREAKLVYYSVDRARIAQVSLLLDTFAGAGAGVGAAPRRVRNDHFSEGGTAATFARIGRTG